MTGLAFLAFYFALNLLTERYQFEALGITLWSPDSGLSVLLLLVEGTTFAPFVFLGQVLVDVLIDHVREGFGVIVAVEATLTVSYVAVAAVLRGAPKFDLKRAHLADVVKLLIVVPAGATLTALTYCGALYLAGSLSAAQLFPAMRHFWVGDTVGVIAVVPAATAAFMLLSHPGWRLSRYEALSWGVFAIGASVGFAVLRSASSAEARQLFYILFLPIIWVGLRLGYGGVAFALLATQTGLFLLASHLGYSAGDLGAIQILMLLLSITGLLLGAVITEREHTTLRLREQQTELARISAHASAGAVGMMLAHEISQPMSTVATYVLAARRMLQSGAASAAVIDVLRKAEAEAQRTGEMLDRVRDFVSSGKRDMSPLDLLDVAVKIRALCLQEAKARNVDVAVEGAPPTPLVRADRIGIEQVLNNLVNNAIDAAAERKDGCGVVTIRIAARDDCVVAEVEDNGPGVAPEIADTMFEPYQSTKLRGMGLGLALSRQIVERHAGALRWEPAATGGARFELALSIGGPDENDA